MAPPRVLVTRPAREAAHWVSALAGHGLRAEALPLIDIVAEPLAGALAEARAGLAVYHAAMFVSSNAVQVFLEQKDASALAPIDFSALNTRAWSPGPGTTAALHRAGWPAERIDAPVADAPQFDSEALWAAVAPQAQAGRRVLIVRGGGADGRPAGRDWLAAQLTRAGVQVDQVLAYRRAAPAWPAAARKLAQAASADGTLWLFSSSEAVANLRQALPAADWSRARCIATHPRIAEAARSAGFGAVHEARPSLADVLASIKSLA